VHVKLLEISTPRLRVRQTKQALEVAGIAILPSAATASQDAPTKPAPKPASQAPTKPAPEFRMDSLLVNGLDIRVVDDASTPPAIVPLNDCDIELRNFSTRAFTEPRSMRFSAMLGAGAIELPKRDKASLLRGFVSAAATAVTGGNNAQIALEKRPFFEEVSTRGKLTLFPKLSGWTKLNLTSFELQGVRGPAQAAGVTIGDGTLDMGVALRFRGQEGMSADTGFVFRNLSMSEPPDGVISRYLKLPAPLDTVLFVLRNEDGEHKIPLSFSAGSGGISTAEVARAATVSLLTVITNAIAASPFRIVGGVVDLAGLQGEEDETTDSTVPLQFAPGDASLGPIARGRLGALASLLRNNDELVLVLRHELSPADLERAEQLGNPSADACRQLIARLRQSKAETIRSRDLSAARARAAFATNAMQTATQASASVRRLDQQLAHIEASLDAVASLLRRGANRRRPQRTRRAAIAIAGQRLQVVRQALLGSGIDPSRIDMRRARFKLAADRSGKTGGDVLATPKARIAK